MSRVPNHVSRVALLANLVVAWILVAVAAFYALAWLVPPGQAGSPMDLRPINPIIASSTALLWSVTTLLLAMPSFRSRSVLFRVAAIAAPVVAFALVCMVHVRA